MVWLKPFSDKADFYYCVILIYSINLYYKPKKTIENVEKFEKVAAVFYARKKVDKFSHNWNVQGFEE